MCGRYSLKADLDSLKERFDFTEEDLHYGARYNIAPTQQVLAVVNEEGNRGQYMRWGLIPFWAKDAKVGQRMINARAETVAESRAFRTAFLKRRCLILADGFYEWKQMGTRKIPMYIGLKDKEPFAFAGLWEVWKDATGEFIRSCTIITTEPNELMSTIHNRMPVILPREAEDVWLDHSVGDPQTLQKLLVPYPAQDMDAYPVSPLANSPRNDTPDLIAPATGFFN